MAPIYSRDESWDVQPGREEEAQGDLTHVYKFLMGEVKKREADCSLWCPLKGQEAVGTN